MSLSTTDLHNVKKTSSAKGPLTPKKYSASYFESGIERIRVDDENEIEKIYQFGEVLGRGAFGVVREVTHKDLKEKFAMKTITKDKPGSVSIQLLEREVEVLKRVNHPSIIRVITVYETAKKMYIIMELCAGGELSDELKKRTYFKEEDAKAVVRRIVEAVVYMHDNDMVHRDLKLENVLLSTSDPSDFNVKVTDFGLASMKGLPGCEDLMHSKCGTPYYMAPEVLDTRHEYTKMCDVWSLGVIMYALMCGKFPFQSTTPMGLEEVIYKGELTFSEIEWINVSQTAKDLIRNMLSVNTTSRFTARRILDDPWFTGEHSKKKMDALEMMRYMDSESYDNKIVVRTPSGNVTTSNTSLAASSSSQVSATTPTHTPKVAGSNSHNSSLVNPQRKTPNQTTPTKKPLKHKPRTQSSSALTTKVAGTSSGTTSPSHKNPDTNPSTRPRGFSHGNASKSQVLTPPGVFSASSSLRGSNESMGSNSSREKKAVSPNRTSRTKT